MIPKPYEISSMDLASIRITSDAASSTQTVPENFCAMRPWRVVGRAFGLGEKAMTMAGTPW